MTHDFFDGTFDNSRTLQREVWQDGERKRYAAKNCTGDTSSPWAILRPQWGAFPDHPINQAQAA